MDIQQILVLRGPNVWANFPVLEVLVRLSRDLDVPSNSFPGFNDRLMSWLPSMIEHRCGIGERGGFFQRLRTGTYLGHILEHTALEIQSLVGPPVGFGRARESIIPGLYRVAIEYADERLGLACVQTAIKLLDAAREGTPFAIEDELARLRAHAEQVCLGPSTGAIVSEAKARKIPSIRLNDGNLVQLGYGSAQHRIWTAESEHTSAVAESIASDKQLTRGMLRSIGVPVPDGRAVSTAEEAWEAARDLGLPVVVKPREGHWGRGVSINLDSREAIRKAFDLANAEGGGVIVEQFITGLHHRILVVGNRVVAAARGEPDQVVADGVHDVAELVDIANSDPKRGDPQTHPLSRLELDGIALELLAQHGYTPESVPAAGTVVVLHYNGDPTEDVTALVHPATAKMAVLVAKTVGLNIAGLDVVVEDIARPLEEQRGAVLEVNSSPGLLMHLRPQKGQAQPVGAAIVDEIFGPERCGRIPIVTISGTNGKSSVVALLEGCFGANSGTFGKKLGVACSEGLFVDGRALVEGDATDYDSVERLLVNPFVDVVLAEMNPRTVLTQGIAFDQCDVAVVTNVGSSDHLGYTAMDRDRMILVERCGVDMVLPTGTAVLNADDDAALEMAPKCKGSVLLFATDHLAEPLVAHRAGGGRTVAFRNGRIVFSVGDKRVHEAKWERASSSFDLSNQLAALGAAWALGVDPAQAIDRVSPTAGQPRSDRLRLFDHQGCIVAISTCRNPSAFEAVTRSLEQRMPNTASARRVALCSNVAFDWGIDDAKAIGALVGSAFDRIEIVSASSDFGQLSPARFADHPSAEHTAAVRVAFADGVTGAARATIEEPKESLAVRLRNARSELRQGDLLFVQVSEMKQVAEVEGVLALWNAGEDLRKHCGSSTVTDAVNLTRPQAET